jgi:hypothetical protein
MGEACSTNVERRNAYRLLMGKPEGKRPIERSRRKLVASSIIVYCSILLHFA